ncbi:sensor histidine kinase [Nocardia goodfellowii]|uniref:histidine kinase n=1 Tax=Nocardia goodfellowii TaxID=882446 RepID=A0ABS4QFS6_9NOCA|nr:histidine kinase [Nocardia goodfellowii]MBP2190545.1 signal transduction histidine kinase [Nocardia goodfellowii]
MTETVPRRDQWLLLRCVPLALVPLLLLASTFPGQYRVPMSYWLLSMTAAALLVLGVRWPLAVSVALSALAIPMFLADAWGLSGLVPYLGAVALTDAVMRTHHRGAVALAAACWAASLLIGLWFDHMPFWRAATAVETVAYAGLPLLLGLYLRAQRDLAEKFRLEALAAEARRAEAESHTRAAERSALARELHDLVAHHMASIVLRVEVARHVLADPDPRVSSVLDDVHGAAADSLADIRRLLVALRDPDLGAVALVESETLGREVAAAVERARAAGFVIDADLLADPSGLDAVGRLTLLRIVQESLTNVMKHADRALPVAVTVARGDGGITVRIGSGGRGVPPNPLGHGIIGIRERVDIAGGLVQAGPAPDGWIVEAWLPATATRELTPR